RRAADLLRPHPGASCRAAEQSRAMSGAASPGAEWVAELVADVGTIAWLTGGLALLVVILPLPWRISRTVVTIVHESGHALTGFAVGRRVRGLRLPSDTSGVTVSRGRRSGPGMVCTTLAGYPAPAVLGLLFAGMLRLGWHSAVLVVAAVLLLGVLILVRNVYGVFAVLAAAAVLSAVSALATLEVRTGFVYFICWFLLLAAIRPVIELGGKRRRRGSRDS